MTYTNVTAAIDAQNLRDRLICERRSNGKIMLSIGPDILIWLDEDDDLRAIQDCLAAYLKSRESEAQR